MRTTSQTRPVPNESYQPDEDEEAILAVLKREGRANPLLIRDETDIAKQYVNNGLNNLIAAGWVRRVTTGLYEFVADPREDGPRPVTLDGEEVADLIEVLERADVDDAEAWVDRLREADEDG